LLVVLIVIKLLALFSGCPRAVLLAGLINDNSWYFCLENTGFGFLLQLDGQRKDPVKGSLDEVLASSSNSSVLARVLIFDMSIDWLRLDVVLDLFTSELVVSL